MRNRRKLIVLFVSTVVGVTLGVAVIGLLEVFPALVMPHGGWRHVNFNWDLVVIFAAIGGVVGMALGAVINLVWRRG